MRDDDVILMAHGGGGELMLELIRDEILSRFGGPSIAALADSAIVDLPAGRLAFTTDGYVVQPLFFPGGDIGRLAISGTVNDLACVGIFIGFRWDDGRDVEVQQALVNPLGPISLVAGQRDRPGDRLAVVIKKFRIGAFEYGDQCGRFVGLSRRQMVSQRMAFTVAQDMDFCRKTPTRAA